MNELVFNYLITSIMFVGMFRYWETGRSRLRIILLCVMPITCFIAILMTTASLQTALRPHPLGDRWFLLLLVTAGATVGFGRFMYSYVLTVTRSAK